MKLDLIRAFRTLTSERFVLRRGEKDVGTVDIHYPAQGAVRATLFLDSAMGTSEEEIGALLKYLDETLLPDASLDDHTLVFSVVVGKIVGDFHANAK